MVVLSDALNRSFDALMRVFDVKWCSFMKFLVLSYTWT